jgi:hypothetical protein
MAGVGPETVQPLGLLIAATETPAGSEGASSSRRHPNRQH